MAARVTRSVRRWAIAAAATGLAVVGLPAGAAQAASTWSGVQTLSRVGADSPRVAVDARGDAVAVWTRFDGAHNRVQTASRPAGGSWSAPVTLSAGGQNAVGPGVAVDARGDAVAMWLRFDGTDNRVQAASRRAGGSWSRPITLSAAGANAVSVQVAADATGDVTAVWQLGTGVSQVQSASRPAGEAWSRAVTLSSPGFDPQVAMDAKGDATAVWIGTGLGTGYGLVMAAQRPVGGAWTTPVNVDAPVGLQSPSDAQVAMDAKGNAVAVWSLWDNFAWRMQAARLPAGGAWSSPVSLATGDDYTDEAPMTLSQDYMRPQVGLSANGDAVAVWSLFTFASCNTNCIDRWRVQAARLPAGGAWATPVTLAVSGHALKRLHSVQLKVDAKGDAVAVWPSDAADHEVVRMARRPAGGAWTAPVTLSPGRLDGFEPDVAMDAHGRAVSVWRYDSARRQGRVQAVGLDAAGPMTALTKPAVTQQRQQRFSVAWSTVDRWPPVASSDVRLRVAPFNAEFGGWTVWRSSTTATQAGFTGAPGNTYCLQARSRDAVGNVGPWSKQRCTAIPLDDRALVRHGGWVHRNADGYFRGTFTSGSAHAARLTVGGLQVKHLALLVSTCPDCGTVAVSLDGQRLGRYELTSSTARTKVLINVATFTQPR